MGCEEEEKKEEEKKKWVEREHRVREKAERGDGQGEERDILKETSENKERK